MESGPPCSFSSRAWVPVHSDDGVFQGCVNTTYESTQGVLAERRMSMLQSLGSRTGGYCSGLLLSALIPFSAVAQTTHAFTSAMLSTLEWNPKEYVKMPAITSSNLFVASPLRHSTLQRCRKSVSEHLEMSLYALFTHKASTRLYARYVDTSDPVQGGFALRLA